MKKHIEVVAAVIKKDNKIFCAKRADKGELAKKWEFPGGKIEIGETREEALVRELREELKIETKVNKFLKSVNHEYNTFELTLHAFEVEIISGQIVLTEHLDQRWLEKDKLGELDWAAADIPVVKLLMG